jgi:predicted ATP-grasp superfamily ATP-dependent carboligase
MDAGLEETLSRRGRALVGAFGLRGLFGVDLIVSDGVPWTIEVNPRYTASVEVVELATGRALVAEHARAFGVEPPGRDVPPGPRPGCVGKVVVYAKRSFAWPDWPLAIPWRLADPWALPRYADVPAAGTEFGPGDPVLTLIEGSDGAAECARRLRRRVARWRVRLGRIAGVGP